MACKFAKRCRYYQPNHEVCKSRDAEHGFCGAYRSFLAWDAQYRITTFERIFYGMKSLPITTQ
jgi:hypothetical protein